MSAPKIAKRPKSEKKPAASGDKKRKPRKPPMERALRLADQAERKANALIKNVSRWKIASVDDHAAEVQALQTNLTHLKAYAGHVVGALADLRDAQYEPVTAGGGGGRAPLAVGDPVAIRSTRYEPEAHGPNNKFVVQALRGKLFEVSAQDDEALRHCVPRAWLTRLATVEAAD